MSDTLNAPDAGAGTPAPAPVAGDEGYAVSEHGMAQILQEKWKKQREGAEAPVQMPDPPAQENQAQEADSSPPQEATAETAQAEPVAEPSLGRPQSWGKDREELWSTLTRQHQEYILDNERERSKGISRAQNEAAEERKAAQAARDAAEKARQEYDNALPQLIQTLKTAQAGEFADIKTQDDVNKLAAEDWPRFARWQAHMMQVGTLEQEAKAAQERQASEFKNQWNEFASKEDKRFLENHPEFADNDKRSKIAEAVLKTAESAGITRDELIKSYNGELTLSPRSAALQEIFLKAALYDQAKSGATAKTAVAKAPPVQRPGTSQPSTNSVDAEIETLTRRVAKTGSLKDATALRLAKMRRAQG
jgi:hypothetical protein